MVPFLRAGHILYCGTHQWEAVWVSFWQSPWESGVCALQQNHIEWGESSYSSLLQQSTTYEYMNMIMHLYNIMYTKSLSLPHPKQKSSLGQTYPNQWLHAFTTEGSTLSASRLGPSRWAVGEPSLESVLLSDEFILVSLTLVFTTLAVITYIVNSNCINNIRGKIGSKLCYSATAQVWRPLTICAHLHHHKCCCKFHSACYIGTLAKPNVRAWDTCTPLSLLTILSLRGTAATSRLSSLGLNTSLPTDNSRRLVKDIFNL